MKGFPHEEEEPLPLVAGAPLQFRPERYADQNLLTNTSS
jgi:hypothetical protein